MFFFCSRNPFLNYRISKYDTYIMTLLDLLSHCLTCFRGDVPAKSFISVHTTESQKMKLQITLNTTYVLPEKAYTVPPSMILYLISIRLKTRSI